MEIELEQLLHPQIEEACLKLLSDEHYKHAAHEAMKQVEIALRDKGLAPHDKFGEQLIKWVLGGGDNIRVVVPFGKELQDQARLLFRGAFSYYRNYSAHDGAKIDRKSSIRIMILASELLDLLNASRRSLESLGGVEALINLKVFKDKDDLISFLQLLNGIKVYDEVGEISVELGENGYSSKQYEFALELGLCEYIGEYIRPPSSLDELISSSNQPVGYTQLTDQGQILLNYLAKDKNDILGVP